MEDKKLFTPLGTLKHSFKGTTWKDHKYIKKEGDHYIYSKEATKSGAYDNDIDAKRRKIDELYTVKIHHQEALAKAQESGDIASAEQYQTYIDNIDKQISELEEDFDELTDHKYAKYMSPGNATKLSHSAKGTTWKKGHKYIKKEDGRYYYNVETKGGHQINAETDAEPIDKKADETKDKAVNYVFDNTNMNADPERNAYVRSLGTGGPATDAGFEEYKRKKREEEEKERKRKEKNKKRGEDFKKAGETFVNFLFGDTWWTKGLTGKR